MKIGVSLSLNVSKFGPLLFSGNFEYGIKEIKRLGYEGVELSILDSTALDQDKLITTFSKQELKVFTLATGQSYVHDGVSIYNEESEKIDIAVERVKDHIDFAARLGAAVIIGGIRGKITTEDKMIWQKTYKKGMDALLSCLDHADSKQVTLLLEPINRYETNIINTISEGLELIEEIGSSYLRLLPDTFHMNIEESSMVESLLAAKDNIGYIHFADSNRFAPGWGHIDFSQILETLRNFGYDGHIGIEVLPHPNDIEAATQAIKHLRLIGF